MKNTHREAIIIQSRWEPLPKEVVLLASVDSLLSSPHIHRNVRDDADFIRFVNMLINDTTFLLDESLEASDHIGSYFTRHAYNMSGSDD